MSRIKQADQAGRPGRQISEQQLPCPSRAIPPGQAQYSYTVTGRPASELVTGPDARLSRLVRLGLGRRTANFSAKPVPLADSDASHCQKIINKTALSLPWQIRANQITGCLLPDLDPRAGASLRAWRGRDGGPGGETSQRPTGPGRGHQTWKPETNANLKPLCGGIMTRTSAVQDSGPRIQEH